MVTRSWSLARVGTEGRTSGVRRDAPARLFRRKGGPDAGRRLPRARLLLLKEKDKIREIGDLMVADQARTKGLDR